MMCTVFVSTAPCWATMVVVNHVSFASMVAAAVAVAAVAVCFMMRGKL